MTRAGQEPTSGSCAPSPITDLVRVPLDLEGIAGRAEAAPGGEWDSFPDGIWIPWTACGDDEPRGPMTYGRWITVQEQDWHIGSEHPPTELWQFLARSRDDVLALVAEVRRLRAAREVPPTGKTAGPARAGVLTAAAA
jgi:hypothetical protein